MARPLTIGAVMYDPKVSVIWAIIRDFFDAQNCPIDVKFYSTYDLQVSTLVDGVLDIAWNSPLAWLDSQRRTGGLCRAVAMRDTDRDRVSHLVARTSGPVRTLADLRGRALAVGAADSPQATLIPLGLLRRHRFDPGRALEVRRFDVLIGKHGDHVGGELDAFRSLQRNEVAACAMLDLNWAAWTFDGTIDPGDFMIVASTDRFDHCVFTVGPGLDPAAEHRWLEALFAMRYDDPQHRQMMDMEGLHAWLPGRTTGFGPLSEAVEAEQRPRPRCGGAGARDVRARTVVPEPRLWIRHVRQPSHEQYGNCGCEASSGLERGARSARFPAGFLATRFSSIGRLLTPKCRNAAFFFLVMSMRERA